MKYSLKEADMPYQYIRMQPLYIVVALKRDNNHKAIRGAGGDNVNRRKAAIFASLGGGSRCGG